MEGSVSFRLATMECIDKGFSFNYFSVMRKEYHPVNTVYTIYMVLNTQGNAINLLISKDS